MKNIQKLWNNRAELLKDSYGSVMDQSFPRPVNEVIHRIHLSEILSVIHPGKTRCLDVGCGFGRLAVAVVKSRPDAFVDGVDIAPVFVSLFNKKMKKHGKALVADAQTLPFKSATFEVVWMVVSLMYFPDRKAQQNVLKEMYRVLKPGGTIVLIEPNIIGEWIVRWGGLLPKIRNVFLADRKEQTGGIAFWPRRLSLLVQFAGFTGIFLRGYPMVTLFLTPLVAFGKIIPWLAGWCLEQARRLDSMLNFPSISYIVTYVARKPKVSG